MTEPRLMSLDTAAARYDINRKTLERMISAGKLRRIKVGHLTRLDVQETDKALIDGAKGDA